ncbi:MAG: hypothetical protein WCK89_02670 [bacterium]
MKARRKKAVGIGDSESCLLLTSSSTTLSAGGVRREQNKGASR